MTYQIMILFSAMHTTLTSRLEMLLFCNAFPSPPQTIGLIIGQIFFFLDCVYSSLVNGSVILDYNNCESKPYSEMVGRGNFSKILREIWGECLLLVPLNWTLSQNANVFYGETLLVRRMSVYRQVTMNT